MATGTGSGSGLRITGIDAARRRLMIARAKAPVILTAATAEALEFVEGRAKAILDVEVYSKSRGEGDDKPDKGKPGSLYSSFYTDLAATAATAVRGALGNSAPHAIFLELGTDNEGSGSHYVAAIRGGALHWVNPSTGKSAFSKGHEVKGIVPIRFLERALTENRAQVKAIFAKHFERLFA